MTFEEGSLVFNSSPTVLTCRRRGEAPGRFGIPPTNFVRRVGDAGCRLLGLPVIPIVGNDPLMEGIPNRPGASPRRLQVSTVGDELKTSDPSSKVISISIKDRSAVLPAVPSRRCRLLVRSRLERLVTSNYYAHTLPEWAAKANGEQWYQRYLGGKWFAFDAKTRQGSRSVRWLPAVT